MSLPAISRPAVDEQLDRLKREESFALREAVRRADRLVTHESPDLDALLSLALAQLYRSRFNGTGDDLPIAFVPGNCRDFPKGTLALDIGDARGLRSTPSGGMMLKASQAGGSCCTAVARLLRDDDYNIIETFIREVSLTDEDKEMGTIQRIRSKYKLWANERDALICTSIFDIFQSLRYTSYDFELYQIFRRLVEGILIRGHKRRFFHERNSWEGVETYYNGRFAVLPVYASIYHAKVLENHGVEVSLYMVPLKSKRDVWSLAIHRAPKALMNLEELFHGKMTDFSGIFMNEFFVGWGAKGGGLNATESEARLIRDNFIQRVKNVLEPWYSMQHR
jgi:hypothetical protein